MRYGLLVASLSFSLGVSNRSYQVAVHISAQSSGAVARVTGPGVKVIHGKTVRADKRITLVSIPADVSIDADSGEFFFQLDRDTAWVSLLVTDANGHQITASARNLVVRFSEGKLQVVGAPPNSYRNADF